MPFVALSTSWMVRRFERLPEFFQAAREAGFDRYELSRNVTPAMLAEVAPGEVAISSVHAPGGRSIAGGEANLASRNEEERRAAVTMTQESIDVAVRYGAPAVVLHLGTVEIDIGLLKQLQQLYMAGQQESRDFRAAQERMVGARIMQREPHYGAALRSLTELAAYARERGIRLGLENRLHYHEIPSLEEVKDLLSSFDREVVGYWHDVGHAHVLGVLGLTPEDAWLRAFGNRLLGMHLHDARGIRDHQPPGHGELDFGLLRPYLTEDVLAVCEFERNCSPEDIRAGREMLVQQGLVR